MKKIIIFSFLTLTFLSVGLSQIADYITNENVNGYDNSFNYIELDPNQPLSDISQSRLNYLQSQNDEISIHSIKINDITPFLIADHLIFQDPLTESTLNFEVDFVFDRTNYEESPQYHQYSISGYSPNGNSINIMVFDGYVEGFIKLETVWYKITSLDEGQAFLIEYPHPPLSGFDDVCGTKSDGPIDPLYSDNGIQLRCGESVSILVLHTEDVPLAFDPNNVARAIVQQMNDAAQVSGVRAQYNLAGNRSYLLNNFTPRDVGPSDDPVGIAGEDLNDLQQNDELDNLRTYHRADIVVVLVPDESYLNNLSGQLLLGITPRGKKAKDALCIVDVDAAISFRFTAIHEIGHILGARHQRPIPELPNCLGDDKTNCHGFLLGPLGGTVLVQWCATSRRLMRFSNNTITIREPGTGQNIPTGNDANNNSYGITKFSKRAACFLEGRSPDDIFDDSPLHAHVGMSGDGFIDDCSGSASWIAEPDEDIFVDPITYRWEWSETGVDNWHYLGDQKTLTVFDLSIFPDIFYLRVAATGSEHHFGQAIKKLRRQYCINGGSTRDKMDNSVVQDKDYCQLFNLCGQRVFSGDYHALNDKLTQLSNGIYILQKINNHNSYEVEKIYIY